MISTLKKAIKAVYYFPKILRAKMAFLFSANESQYLPPNLIGEWKSRFKPVGDYGYDSESVRLRGVDRAGQIIAALGERKVSTSLELGCMDAMTSVALVSKGIKTSALDIENKLDARATQAGITFYSSPAEKIPVSDGTFDLVFSFNSMEHFADPRVVINEVRRVLKPGGYLYVDFDPLYYSPRGLHAYRKINIPYCQVLFKHSDLENYAANNKLNWSELPYVNKYSADSFREIFGEMKKDFSFIDYSEGKDLTALQLISRYPSSFKASGLPFNNFVVSRIKFLALKKG